MQRAQATRIAIQAIEAEIKRVAVNANLHDLMHADTPTCVKASARRRELHDAIQALREPAQVRMQL